MAAPPAEAGGSLVIWGSTGRRLQFSKQDLTMPAHIKALPNAAFYEKQWGAVSGFWFNRVLKETALQHMQVADIVRLIEKDIEKRWQARRAEQAIYKKKKRLLASTAESPVGAPSESILLTNVCSFTEYETDGTAESRRELLAAITGRVEEVTADTVSDVRVLVDAGGDGGGRQEEDDSPAAKQKVRTESTATPEAEAVEKREPSHFDDRVAVVCRLSSKDKAASAIAHLHGSVFDGRTVVCRFWTA